MNGEKKLRMSYTKEMDINISLPVQRKREYGIDALRIVSMFFVVLLHMVGNGGILPFSEPLSGTYNAGWFLGVATQCAVNCYGMISGYVGLNSKFRYTNIIMLWLQVAFYTIGITALFWFINPELVGTVEIKSAIFPVYFKQYWYFSAYFCLFFFIPALNIVVHKLPKKQLEAILVSLLTVFSILPTVFERDSFHLIDGYSVLWLGVLYLIGAYIKKYGFANKCSVFRWLSIYAICIILSWALKLGIEKYQFTFFSDNVNGELPIKYISPLMVIAAVSLMGAFARIKPGKTASRIIKFISPLTFGIYLIHVQPYIWMTFNKKLLHLLNVPVYEMIVRTIGVAVIVFTACMIIEYLRGLLFSLLKIKKIFLWIENKTIGNLWDKD